MTQCNLARNTQKNKSTGFTLIEMLVTIAVIAILLTLAVPDQRSRLAKLQIEEVIKYSDSIKPKISDYYAMHNSFPVNNMDAGLPSSDKLISTLVKDTTIENGAIHFTLGNNALSLLQDQVLTLQPLTVTGNSTSPIDWTCGFSKVPTGMQANGNNKTTLTNQTLPTKCMQLP